MKTFLQFFTEGNYSNYNKESSSQEFQDKIVAYKKDNPDVTATNIGKKFNLSVGTIRYILSKNWPDWQKYSTT